MRFALRSLAAAFAVLACTAAAAPERVEYTLTPVMRDGVLTAVQIDLRFRGDADGETRLLLPDSWGGQDELYRGVEALEIVSGAEMRTTDDPALKLLTHQPNARIRVRYRIIQDWDGVPRAELGNTYRPVIQPDYFHLIGSAALVMPDIDLASPVRVRTRTMPRGWRFASDLEHAGLNLGRTRASVMVGGDFRIVRGVDPNVRVAMRGEWTFSDANFATEAAEIIAGQRRFFGDSSTPFLVTVIPLTSPNASWISIGGTGLEDAFAFFATRSAEANQITRTLAHEGLHTWIPGRVGGMPDEDEAADYWFSEGFTDFFTGRVLMREGVWTPQEFADDLNDMLRAYGQSSVQREPNARVVADFWNDQDVQKLPYQRGRLLATIWDARLRAHGRDLDDVMLEMRERARAGDPLKAAAMFPIVMEAMGQDVAPDIAAHVDAGAPILLPEDVLAPCGRVNTREAPVFHRGFDIEATTANNNVIIGVDPALPAYAAGLRDGMVLIRRDAGEIGDAEQEIAYVVRDGETERTLRYMPRGHGSFTVQRLVLEEDLTGERLAECVRVLGGAG
jgi:predicted metalloprotease with PDZ domain